MPVEEIPRLSPGSVESLLISSWLLCQSNLPKIPLPTTPVEEIPRLSSGSVESLPRPSWLVCQSRWSQNLSTHYAGRRGSRNFVWVIWITTKIILIAMPVKFIPRSLCSLCRWKRLQDFVWVSWIATKILLITIPVKVNLRFSLGQTGRH